MDENEFRPYARLNVNTSVYFAIACEHYVSAKTVLNEISNHKFDVAWMSDFEHRDTVYRDVTICTVFSAMTIEAFLNDYGAWRLGDKFFYDNFERLSALSKLQLISRFLLDNELDKGEKLYSETKKLFSRRDEYVHNKSKAIYDVFSIFSDQPVDDEDIDVDEMFNAACNSEEKRLKEIFSEAKESIKAVCDFASFFEKHDKLIDINFLFFANINSDTNSCQTIYRVLQKDFGI